MTTSDYLERELEEGEKSAFLHLHDYNDSFGDSMKPVLLFALLALVGIGSEVATGQITTYQDSTEFDDDFGRLRDIDFEDLYGLTVDRIRIRNPYAIESLAVPDSQGNPTSDNILFLSQGATMAFPTRTRTVTIEGYGNPFYVEVTTFADSTYMLDLASFPTTIHDDNGIARIQFFGTDAFGLDINWGAGLRTIDVLDQNDVEIASSNFDELEGDRYYFMGTPLDVSSVEDTVFTDPVTIHGITIHEPTIGLIGYHLSYFEARVDSDNPIGNIAVPLLRDATISFDSGTEGALLVLEQVYVRDTMFFEAVDYNNDRDTVMVVGWGREYDTNWVEDQQATFAHVAFASEAGIKEIRLLDAWTSEVVDFADTVIDGEYIEIDVYGAVGIEVLIAAVHVAESPTTEINGIVTQVEEVNDAGYLVSQEATTLVGQLREARQNAAEQENGKAVEQLQQFRAEVEELYSNGTLVTEEARYLDRDAVYIISRLQSGSSGVDRYVTDSGLEMPEITDLRVLPSGLSVSYRMSTIGGEEATVTNLRGEVIWRASLDQKGEGTIVWDMSDSDGGRIPPGPYFLSIGSGSVRTTAKFMIVR